MCVCVFLFSEEFLDGFSLVELIWRTLECVWKFPAALGYLIFCDVNRERKQLEMQKVVIN